MPLLAEQWHSGQPELSMFTRSLMTKGERDRTVLLLRSLAENPHVAEADRLDLLELAYRMEVPPLWRWSVRLLEVHRGAFTLRLRTDEADGEVVVDCAENGRLQVNRKYFSEPDFCSHFGLPVAWWHGFRQAVHLMQDRLCKEVRDAVDQREGWQSAIEAKASGILGYESYLIKKWRNSRHAFLAEHRAARSPNIPERDI